MEEPDVARKTIVDEQSDDEPISKDVESLLAAAKGVDPDIEKDAQVLAKMYKFCHYAKENSSTSFTPQIKQLTLAYNSAKKSLVKRLDAKKSD